MIQCNDKNFYVLVVDDDEFIREAVREILELEDISVQTAKDGKEALEKLEQQTSPCLILLDLNMPRLNGWDFLLIARRSESIAHLPIVVITAQMDQTKGLTVDGVMKKPIDIDALLSVVHKYCETKKAS